MKQTNLLVFGGNKLIYMTTNNARLHDKKREPFLFYETDNHTR